MVIHLFISEAIIAAAMYTRIKQGGGPTNQVVMYDVLFEQVSFLSQLFRGEFVFPSEGIKANFHRTLTGLEADGVIAIDRTSDPINPKSSDKQNNYSNVLSVQLSQQERDSGRENYDFYCFLIWPFIESSWLAGVALIGLTPPYPRHTGEAKPTQDGEVQMENGNKKKGGSTLWVPSKATQDMAQLLGKTLYHQGDLSYFEAVNKQTIANAFLKFEQEGIILVRKPNASPPPLSSYPDTATKTPTTTPSIHLQSQQTGNLYSLAPEWQPSRDPSAGAIIPQGRLWDFVEKIAKSRREGKNRRDGATVSRRVVGLVGELGEALVNGAGVMLPDEGAEVEGEGGKIGGQPPHVSIGVGTGVGTVIGGGVVEKKGEDIVKARL